MRGRGLKLVFKGRLKSDAQVAPHAGAWIETCVAPASFKLPEVAPHAGAWIETLKI